MKARVFHFDADAVRARGGSGFDGEAVWPDEYRLVARVDIPEDRGSVSDALGLVYQATNHIDHAWWENPGVERVGPETRSTSVGDVVLIEDAGFLCDRVGWKEFSVARPAVTAWYDCGKLTEF